MSHIVKYKFIIATEKVTIVRYKAAVIRNYFKKMFKKIN